jgi:hypothetical protein
MQEFDDFTTDISVEELIPEWFTEDENCVAQAQ